MSELFRGRGFFTDRGSAAYQALVMSDRDGRRWLHLDVSGRIIADYGEGDLTSLDILIDTLCEAANWLSGKFPLPEEEPWTERFQATLPETETTGDSE